MKYLNELNLEELEQIVAGAHREAAVDSALKNDGTYRKELIEQLKKDRETLENIQKENTSKLR